MNHRGAGLRGSKRKFMPLATIKMSAVPFRRLPRPSRAAPGGHRDLPARQRRRRAG